jgi:hypothetical protein
MELAEGVRGVGDGGRRGHNLCKVNLILYSNIYIQQDATLLNLFISGKCSTCFGWYHHPSSGAHTIVTTAFGIRHTVMDTVKLLLKCIERCKNMVLLKSSWTYHLKHIKIC